MDHLKSLEVFACIADAGNLTRCASTLSLSRSAVTRAVNKLESQLNLRLLQRSTHKVTLTSEGEQVLEHARELLHAFRALEAVGNENAAEIAGEIRVNAPTLFGAHFAGRALATFAARHPATRIDLQLIDAGVDVIGSSADLTICLARRLPQTMVARRAGEVAIGLYASPGYLQSSAPLTEPSQLGEHECLVHRGLPSGIDWVFAAREPRLRQTYRHRPVGRFTSNSQEALLNAAQSGLGLAMLPEFAAAPAVLTGRLRRVLKDWSIEPLRIHLVYAREHQSARLRRLVQHLVDSFGAQVALAGRRSEADGGVQVPARCRMPSMPCPRPEAAREAVDAEVCEKS